MCVCVWLYRTVLMGVVVSLWWYRGGWNKGGYGGIFSSVVLFYLMTLPFSGMCLLVIILNSNT